MENQYKAISSNFREARMEMPLTRFLEAPSIISVVGPLTSNAVVDFACGEGFFTRVWRRLGGDKVVGVDLSPEMIQLACDEERRSPLGITYMVGDASQIHKIGDFDIATAIFLFNYAECYETLVSMFNNVACNLKDGGRLVAVVPNPDFINGRQETLPYGFFLEEIIQHPSGSVVKMTFTGPKTFSIEFTQWKREVYERALVSAGFENPSWTFFSVSDEGFSELGEDFWRAELDNPKSVILSAVKRKPEVCKPQLGS